MEALGADVALTPGPAEGDPAEIHTAGGHGEALARSTAQQHQRPGERQQAQEQRRECRGQRRVGTRRQ